MSEIKRSLTVGEFCLVERFSKTAYYGLKSRGLAPDEFEIPGTRIKRITPEAHAAWRERMAALAQSEAAQLEAERRRAQAVAAGRIAAASPLHVSKRQKPRHQRRVRL
jgi:hypothetical protein